MKGAAYAPFFIVLRYFPENSCFVQNYKEVLTFSIFEITMKPHYLDNREWEVQ